MKKETAEWFETTVSYKRLTEKEVEKQVRERYVVRACSFGDAEKTIIEETFPTSTDGEIDVQKIIRANYQDVYFDNENPCGVYYKVKVSSNYITDNGDEKEEIIHLLVEASSIESARKKMAEALSLHDGCGMEITGMAKMRLSDVLDTNVAVDDPQFIREVHK